MKIELSLEQAAALERILRDYRDDCSKCDCDTCKWDVQTCTEIAKLLITSNPFTSHYKKE